MEGKTKGCIILNATSIPSTINYSYGHEQMSCDQFCVRLWCFSYYNSKVDKYKYYLRYYMYKLCTPTYDNCNKRSSKAKTLSAIL